MICSRCRRAPTLYGKRSCHDCHEYNVRRSRFLSLTSELDDRQSLYAMRTLSGHLKVGRSNNVPRRCRQLSADVVRSWPGLGRLLVAAVSQSDYPLAQGAFFLISLVLIILNLIVDLVYGWLDPRVSHG